MVIQYQVQGTSFDNTAKLFCKSLEKWHFLKAHISLTWQNSVSRSFPTALLVQSSVCGTAPVWHQVNPLVIAGMSFLWRGSLLQSQMGVWITCQGKFKIWNATEKKVVISFNCLLSLQKFAFHIFRQILQIYPVWKTVKNVVSLCICLQLNIVPSAKRQPSWSHCKSV